ncbi:MAG: hypothetical protein KME03_15225 [Aphanocapsa lilacina HA4352-LM1]|jgi:hypothetical protein|uniref:Uncharacterized protein n=1 Tax=Gloeobacter morelensis MG652769 TaxID=2781736 RepID=A0ABY3PRY9_9CYAN|nr:hypothetical protein [Gloeobacter morelensis]MBW4699215.1 hypothetical protein [Aphanocapsa lilacina HA4352-LM1]UFP96379.1 hypothetical protein ISF26_09285 [Gloeobacter morelensis MG652769]
MFVAASIAAVAAFAIAKGYRSTTPVALLWAVAVFAGVSGGLWLLGGGRDPLDPPSPETVEAYEQLKGANRKR